MGLYNFKERFVPKILSGEKTHTIRANRINPDKPGSTLHLYTGLRTKKARLLMRVPCLRVDEISISLAPENLPFDDAARVFVTIDGTVLHRSECETLARRDGFDNFDEMLKFWDGRLPFYGRIVYWRFAFGESQHEHTDVRQVPIPVHSHEENEA